MEPTLLSSTTLVADVLAISPRAAPVFIEMHLGCPGCAMVRFCTIADLCKHYTLDIQSIISALNATLIDICQTSQHSG